MVLTLRRIRKACAGTAAAVLVFAAVPTAAADEEYALKAAFLYHFAQFAEWPQEDPDGEFVIGILGKDPFGGEIDALESERIKGRRVRVRRLQSASEIADCDLVYVGRSRSAREAVLAANAEGVLTVGEKPSFVSKGGMIAFLRDGRKIRFVINRRSAESAGIRISSELLGLAKEVVS